MTKPSSGDGRTARLSSFRRGCVIFGDDFFLRCAHRRRVNFFYLRLLTSSQARPTGWFYLHSAPGLFISVPSAETKECRLIVDQGYQGVIRVECHVKSTETCGRLVRPSKIHANRKKDRWPWRSHSKLHVHATCTLWRRTASSLNACLFLSKVSN